jgi:hypothetical protein
MKLQKEKRKGKNKKINKSNDLIFEVLTAVSMSMVVLQGVSYPPSG